MRMAMAIGVEVEGRRLVVILRDDSLLTLFLLQFNYVTGFVAKPLRLGQGVDQRLGLNSSKASIQGLVQELIAGLGDNDIGDRVKVGGGKVVD